MHDSHSDHDHSHDHDHSVSLWRFFVLSAPIIIVLMGLAPRDFSAQALESRMSRGQKNILAAATSGLAAGRSADGKIVPATIKELQNAAIEPSIRGFWESREKPVRVRAAGQLVRNSAFNDRFNLVRQKITCCAGDATSVNVGVMGTAGPSFKNGEWIEVIGPVSFVEIPNQRTGRAEFFPVIHAQEVRQTSRQDFLQ